MRCAEFSLADEPLAGTAPQARGVVLVEHPGPWGEKALRDVGLGELEARAKERGLKALLIRRADRTPAEGRAFVAWFGAEPFLYELDVRDVLDAVDELATGRLSGLQRELPRMWLVCTNGKRDACCARDGVPVARALARLRPTETWECSHLGGHRFAANVALLPEGICFGRVTETRVVDLVATVERGELPLDLVRGRMALAYAAQAAELAALAETGGRGPLAVELDGAFAIAGGVRVALTEESRPPRPISCESEPEPVTVWRARVVATT